MNDSKMVQYLINSGKIDLSSVQKEMERKEFEFYLAMHPNSIWKGKKDGKWHTYMHTETGRLHKKLVSKDALEQFIVDHYKSQKEQPTVTAVFREWIYFKYSEKEISKGTYDRYSNDFKRFFEGTSFAEMKVDAVTEDDLEDFIRLVIRKHQLTRKAFANCRTLILGIFKRAKKRKLTSLSISTYFKDLELSSNLFKKTVKPKEEQIFLEDEIPVIVNYLRANPTIHNLGLLLAFQTGLRCGELAVLKYTDVKGRTLHIQRQETKSKNDITNKTEVLIKDYPKSDAGNRYVIITDSALETLEMVKNLNPNGEYLFEAKGKRVRADRYNKLLYQVCRALAIPERSMHKIRRTYGTTLIDEGVTESVIMEQMGHADIATTHAHYYYGNKTQKTKEEQIAKAITI